MSSMTIIPWNYWCVLKAFVCKDLHFSLSVTLECIQTQQLVLECNVTWQEQSRGRQACDKEPLQNNAEEQAGGLKASIISLNSNFYDHQKS